MTPGQLYLSDVRIQFEKLKSLAERALDQVDDNAFFHVPYEDGNSMAIVVKHMAGNMRSRWRDFLTSDGEKADRHRNQEFEMFTDDRSEVMSGWESGWATLYSAIDPLTEDQLTGFITIRDEPHHVMQAINRQLSHYAYHVGQIVHLAREAKGADWTSLSVPRGGTEAFNKAYRERMATKRQGE